MCSEERPKHRDVSKQKIIAVFTQKSNKSCKTTSPCGSSDGDEDVCTIMHFFFGSGSHSNIACQLLRRLLTGRLASKPELKGVRSNVHADDLRVFFTRNVEIGVS